MSRQPISRDPVRSASYSRRIEPGLQAGPGCARRDRRAGGGHTGLLRPAGPALDVLRARSGGSADRPGCPRSSLILRTVALAGSALRSFRAMHGSGWARLRISVIELIVLDVFSSDAIPVHLLSLEAFRLYRSKLANGGSWPSTCPIAISILIRSWACRRRRGHGLPGPVRPWPDRRGTAGRKAALDLGRSGATRGRSGRTDRRSTMAVAAATTGGEALDR